MSGFIAVPPAALSPTGETISGEDFWPDIDLNDFRDCMRVGGNVIPDPRVKLALLGALESVQIDLADWRALQEATGYDTLASVPAATMGGLSRYVVLWRRAVYAYAAADLTETHRDITATSAGASQSEAIAPTADDHRRNATYAVRGILGVSRTTVELI
jgi:hypothetical protein